MLAGSPATGIPAIPAHQHLFSTETYQDLSGSPPHNPESKSHDDDETYMKCTPISDTHIQNNTCVLTPEVTEGPYYHNQDHPIRQNIAGLQDGLLLVCLILAISLVLYKHRTDHQLLFVFNY